jgi:hypothetical protein
MLRSRGDQDGAGGGKDVGASTLVSGHVSPSVVAP